jgi:Domain of unknown function (DUF4291)
MTSLPTLAYLEQVTRWPTAGRHVLAHFDDASVIVYQAYRPSTAQHALAHGELGGPDFSWSRMSWIKPNFLWMMYRSGWATKPGQEFVLGLRIARSFFDELLASAVVSSYDNAWFPTRAAWEAAVAGSNVRLQWDPDHDPGGAVQARRAVQLGLRGDSLRRFGTSELLEVIDMSPLIERQRENSKSHRHAQLQTPTERVYVPESLAAAANIHLDAGEMAPGE